MIAMSNAYLDLLMYRFLKLLLLLFDIFGFK